MITIKRATKTIKAKDYRPKPESPVRHKRALKWEELDSTNQQLFSSVAEKIVGINQDAICYAFGSRVNGNYRDDSDIDIMISNVTELEYDKIMSKISQGELKLDLKLGNEKSQKLILIPTQWNKKQSTTKSEAL